MSQRINPFWLGAGGFLTLFCVNEIIAYHQSLAPVWLGGRLVYWGMIVGTMVGAMIMMFLGVEEAPEEPATAGADDPGDEDDEAPDQGDDQAGGHDGAASPR